MAGDKEVTAAVLYELLLNASEALDINLLWRKSPTKVGTFHVETVNFVPTLHHGPHIVSYRRSTCLVPRSDFFHIMTSQTRNLTNRVPTNKARTNSSYFLKYT
jgi:hypothetical protein